MHFVDRIRQIKIILVVAAIVIAVASLVVSHYLIRDLQKAEIKNVEVWAEAMRALNDADENTDLNLVFKVINGNSNIPVVVLDKDGDVVTFRNVDFDREASDTLEILKRKAKTMLASGDTIHIDLDSHEHLTVCYDESLMLKRLASYPYAQLGVVLIFVVVAIFALLSSKKAEQNKVWVGLSKETAHQLGTPISSLMAWVEILKESYPEDELIPEMDKDVKRLQMIAERFSKIGSLPEPTPSNLNEVVQHVVDYINRRTSNKVQMTTHMPDTEVIAVMNAPLFEWVIENLCKNAVDAMEGKGSIDITVMDEDNRTVIEVADTGKGITKKHFNSVFTPGFTTKKRGWGLGLSLAKRIVEEYHKGRIFVKSSELGKGTVMRIELNKNISGKK